MRVFSFRSLQVAAIVAAGLAVTALIPAKAGLLDVSYTLANGNQVSADLSGNLLADGNTFNITGISWMSLNGVKVADALSVYSLDAVFFGASKSPVATVNGSFEDFYITNGSGSEVLGFGVGDQASQSVGNVAGASQMMGGTGNYEAYNQSKWVQQIAVPEPGSLAILLFPLAAVAFIRKPKRGQATAA